MNDQIGQNGGWKNGRTDQIGHNRIDCGFMGLVRLSAIKPTRIRVTGSNVANVVDFGLFNVFSWFDLSLIFLIKHLITFIFFVFEFPNTKNRGRLKVLDGRTK